MTTLEYFTILSAIWLAPTVPRIFGVIAGGIYAGLMIAIKMT